MEGGSSKSTGKKKARIEIIPLIDVIFFLLATFVLFVLSLNKLQSLPVQLPVGVPHNNSTPPKIVTLQISDTGTLYWNREPITMSELSPRLASYQQANRDDTRILITTDDKALFGQAVAVLDQIRLLNIEQVSIDTTKTYQTGR
jgi:biopolymer transport protein ExbD